MLGASMPFYDSDWTIVVEQEAHELLGPLSALRTRMALMGFVLAGLSFFLYLYVVRQYIVRPLTGMTNAIAGLCEAGDYDLSRSMKNGRKDEIGDMADVINGLIAAFRRIVAEIRSDADKIMDAAHALSRTAAQVGDSSREQSQAASSAAASVEQMSVGVGHIAEQGRETEALSDSAMALAAEGGALAHEAAAEMGRVAESVHISSERVTALNERSAQISGIVEAIRGIADQTNLLALNAAIEAARAGEQGRGFAVVADEVRQLAQRTSTSTSEISALIDSIRSEVGSAAEGMEQTSARAAQGLQLVGQVSEALGRIGAGTRETAGRVREIAGTTGEHSAATNEVAANVDRIAQMASENSTAIARTAESAELLERLADSLQQSVARFRT
jgi:methyl-accepting chemotaxis protein